jgi:Co/Zn/Cd efflux system component
MLSLTFPDLLVGVIIAVLIFQSLLPILDQCAREKEGTKDQDKQKYEAKKSGSGFRQN